MPIAVLTYHACNVLGNDYADNDHVALETDLDTLHRAGFEMVTLDRAVRAAREGASGKMAAITFDDGPVLDVVDFDHPTCGPQKGFDRILREFSERSGAPAPASAFVIASPAAREEMDRVDFGGRDWWHDRWWQGAVRSGRILIESHSWDHNHPSLSRTAHKHNRRGRFDTIDSWDECEAEVRQASEYIARVAGRRPRYFAHPWGQSSDYLRSTYLPSEGPGLGLDAAFGIQGDNLAPGQDRWNLPRWVCGEHWRSADDLPGLLEKR